MGKRSTLSGWGMTAVPGREWRSEQLVEVNQGAALSRGLGRSYGDSSLPSTPDCRVVGTALADRLLHFDPRDGRLRAEAGLSLRSLNQIFLSRGWFPPVTPGTQDVTLGGMVASDVHGKNHHRAGCIGAHVQALLMRVPDGRVMEVSRTREPELFFATLGGMGLTGHILEVELLLESIPSPLIQRRSERFDSLDPLLDALGEAGKSWPFTVAWVDSLAGDEALGRGVLYCGRWATTDEAVPRAPRSRGALRVPFRMPSGLLNRTSIALFNALIYRGHGSKVKQGLVDPLRFFYPLDRIERWNWMYGSRGVTQHQCVLPERAAVAEILRCLRDSGAGSFLTVVKDCGPEGEGLLSFPRSGVSVALDLPIDGRSQEVVDALNEVVISAGGRIYLTKDGFTRRAHFERMESRRAQFARVRRRWDPEGLMRSAQSVRLFGDAP